MSGVKDFMCSKEDCLKSFRTVSQLNDHIKGHENAFVCQLCNKTYKSRSALKFHLQKHKEDTLENNCTVCKKVFSSQKALKMHFKQSHVKDLSDHGLGTSQIETTSNDVAATVQDPTESSNKSGIYCEKVMALHCIQGDPKVVDTKIQISSW